jgi:hypothetical protein
MEMLTPAFSSMVSCVFDEKEGGAAKAQDVSMPPSVRTQKSRLKGGAFGSSDSSDLTIVSCRDVMYYDTWSRTDFVVFFRDKRALAVGLEGIGR